MDVHALFQRSLDDRKGEVAEKTRKGIFDFLRDIADRHPGLPAADITEEIVRAGLSIERQHPRHKRARRWGQSTRRGAITALKVALNRGVTNRLLEKSPIAAMARPRAVRREPVLSEAEPNRILAWYPDGHAFREFLVAMMKSGCPPRGIYGVRCRREHWMKKGDIALNIS